MAGQYTMLTFDKIHVLLNKNTKLDYFNAVLHGKCHGYLFTELGEYQ